MTKIGGRSFSDGIKFVNTKYSIDFQTVSKDTAKVYLKKNEEEKISEFLNKLKKVPILRALLLVYRNFKFILYVIFLQLYLEIRNNNVVVQENVNISKISFIAIIGMITMFLFIFLGKQIEKKLKKTNSIWKYHGAEHKVIETYNKGIEVTYENCLKNSRISDNCGTMFVVLFFFTLVFEFILHLIFKYDIYYGLKNLIILIISSELFLAGRKNKFIIPIFNIGYLFQEKVVTEEPEAFQLMQAVETFKILIDASEGKLTKTELDELCSDEGVEITIEFSYPMQNIKKTDLGEIK